MISRSYVQTWQAYGGDSIYNQHYFFSPFASGRITSAADGYWHTLDESYARISPIANNQWLVWDKDGTQYLLAPTLTWVYPGNLSEPSCFPGPTTTIRWNTVQITDTNANTTRIEYNTESRTLRYGCKDAGWEMTGFSYVSAVYPMTITYALGAAQVLLHYAAKTETAANFYINPNDQWGSGYCVPRWLWPTSNGTWGDDITQVRYCARNRLESIDVTANGQVVRDYAVTYGLSQTLVAQISEIGRNGGSSLPPHSFTYGVSGADKDLLTLADNGYGGQVEFHYVTETVSTVCDDYHCWNAGTNYSRAVVTAKSTRSVAPASAYTVTYAYEKPDMQINGGGYEEKDNKFLGHAVVTETVYASSVGGAVIDRNRSSFYQRTGQPYWYDPRYGKLMGSQVQDGLGNVMISTTNVYTYALLEDRNGYPYYDRNFIRLDQVDQYQCESMATCVQTRANYVYDGYGNIISEYQRGNLATDNDPVNNKSTHRGYIATQNATTYVVNKPNFENVYGTIVGNVGSACGCWKTQTIYYYDDNTIYNAQTITKGELRRVEVTDISNYNLLTTRTAYDAWGNPIVVTDTRGYVMTTAYDSVYHALPTQVTNPLGQQTVTQYDLTLQKPLTVTDPNGAVTSITYDAYGRRTSIWSPTEQGGAATAKLTYSGVPSTVVEAEGGYSGHFCGSAQAGSWLSPLAGGACTNGFLTYGPYWAPVSVGVGQTARFRLSIDTISGSNDNIVRIEVEDASAGYTVIAQRDIKRNEFAGGLTNFSDFALPFDTTGRSGHSIEYRVWWYGAAQVAHDRTTVTWALTSFVYKVEVRTDAPGEATTYQTTASIYNGLGQVVQSQSPSDTAGQIIVTNQRYNALGKVEAASMPASVVGTLGTFVSGEWLALDSRPRTTTAYDALGRTTVITAPDGTTSSTAYGQLAQTAVDANRHFKLSFQDALGRLAAVDETLVRWSDGFDNGLGGWSYWGTVSAANSQLQITGDGVAGHNTAARWDVVQDGQGVVFDFQHSVSDAISAIYLDDGTWQQSDYRRLGLYISGGTIKWDTWIGATNPQTPLLTLQAGVWYRALLKIGGTGEFIVQVWPRDNPEQGVQGRMAPGAGWAGRTWSFCAQGHNNRTLYIDNYDELQFNTTRYGYDVQGNLRAVTDTLGNTTVITYDNLGRKTAMSDPDMGRWLYAYDAAGNLTSQTDAKGQTISFAYDALNRVTSKQYPVNSGQSPVAYTYDTGTNGKGNRTRMDDATGYTTWAYDPRGRVTQEVKSINGAGVFTASTTYDAADRVRSLTYPTGEVITNTYNARGLFNTLTGATPYVNSTTYNALGQVTAQAFGNGVTTNYGYNAANYRLQQIQVGALMDLRYAYDPVGNVTVMTDTANSNQVASFRYDALDRLISASTNAAGNGQYNETYAYDAIGDLLNRSGTTYSYKPETNWVDDGLPAGAVTYTNGGDAWVWVSSNPAPAYGTLAHQSVLTPTMHQHYFYATQTLAVNSGDLLFAYVYLDPANLPREVMLQWHTNDANGWNHRAYWGENVLAWGTDGTVSRRFMGVRPGAGGWVRLEVPAYLVGAENAVVDGMAFTLYDGRATWDRAGLAHGQPHAVTAVGTYTNTYDANGNMARRAEASGTYWQAWNADNHLDTVQYDGFAQYFDYDGDGKRTRAVTYLNGTPSLTDTFDTANAAIWSYDTRYQTVPYNDNGENVARNVGTGANYDANFYATVYSLSHGDSASVDFKVDVNDSIAHFVLETSDGGTYSRWAVIANGGKLYVQYLVNAGAYNWVYPKDLINPVQLNTWYRLTLRVDDVDGFRIEVRERDGGAGSASYQLPMPAGKTWRFHHWTYRGTVLLDNYVERTDSKAVLAYPSALYERNVTAGTDTSYYFAGGKRVAVRNAAGLYFIQGDHLGSNSLTTSITGTEVARTTYYPYGGTRTTSGTAQTDRLFTDQRAESAALGALYDYGARNYDTLLGRFLSADTVIPQASNPQDLNRYGYARNNPLKYTDPSGHECQQADGSPCRYGQETITDEHFMSAAEILERDGYIIDDLGFLRRTGGDKHYGFRDYFDAHADLWNGEWGVQSNGRTYEPGGGEKIMWQSATDEAHGKQGAHDLLTSAIADAGPGALLAVGGAVVQGKSDTPLITRKYQRPSGATSAAMRESVQGKPCSTCGATADKMYADHKEPLVVEYYKTGTIDTTNMRSLDSIQPQCPTCSNRQGGILSAFSKAMAALFGLK